MLTGKEVRTGRLSPVRFAGRATLSTPRLNPVVLRAADLERSAGFYQSPGLAFMRHAHRAGPERHVELNTSRSWFSSRVDVVTLARVIIPDDPPKAGGA